MRFQTFQELVDFLGGPREVAYKLGVNENHLRAISRGVSKFSRRLAFSFLEVYPELDSELLKKIMN